jgi:hypothetical protein
MTGSTSPGREFAEAMADKDFERAKEALDPDVDFRALTPNQSWEATSADAVAREILPRWLEDSDVVEEFLSFEADQFADRERITYSFRGHNDKGPFVVEQQAYLTQEGGQIVWMRVLCSGFRPG